MQRAFRRTFAWPIIKLSRRWADSNVATAVRKPERNRPGGPRKLAGHAATVSETICGCQRYFENTRSGGLYAQECNHVRLGPPGHSTWACPGVDRIQARAGWL